MLHCAVLDAFVPVKRGQGSLKYGVAERWQLEVEEKRGRRRSVRVAGQLRLQEERADAEIFDGFDWVPNPSSPESRGWAPATSAELRRLAGRDGIADLLFGDGEGYAGYGLEDYEDGSYGGFGGFGGGGGYGGGDYDGDYGGYSSGGSDDGGYGCFVD